MRNKITFQTQIASPPLKQPLQLELHFSGSEEDIDTSFSLRVQESGPGPVSEESVTLSRVLEELIWPHARKGFDEAIFDSALPLPHDRLVARLEIAPPQVALLSPLMREHAELGETARLEKLLFPVTELISAFVYGNVMAYLRLHARPVEA